MELTDELIAELKGRDWLAASAQLAALISDLPAEEQEITLLELHERVRMGFVDIWKRCRVTRGVNRAVYTRLLGADLGDQLRIVFPVARHQLGARTFAKMTLAALATAPRGSRLEHFGGYHLEALASADRELQQALEDLRSPP
jgi:hypothetical protein